MYAQFAFPDIKYSLPSSRCSLSNRSHHVFFAETHTTYIAKMAGGAIAVTPGGKHEQYTGGFTVRDFGVLVLP